MSRIARIFHKPKSFDPELQRITLRSLNAREQSDQSSDPPKTRDTQFDNEVIEVLIAPESLSPSLADQVDMRSEASAMIMSSNEPIDLLSSSTQTETTHNTVLTLSPSSMKMVRQPLVFCQAQDVRMRTLTTALTGAVSIGPDMLAAPRTNIKSILEEIPKLRSVVKQARLCISELQNSMGEIIAETLTGNSKLYCDAVSSDLTALRERLREEMGLRRKLHNMLQELKGNIRVYVRIRPLLPAEISRGLRTALSMESETSLVIHRADQKREFTFDRVFASCTSNNELFTELQQLVVSSMDGFNVAILAYGITGSGKTYTMQGIYDRIGMDLFEIKSVREKTSGWRYSLRMSIYEVYNEAIVDLLDLKNIDTGFRTNTSTGFFFLPGITSVAISGPSDVQKALVEASQNRSVSSTNCNEQSSRSHQVATINLEIETPFGKQLNSKVSLVDLAGSERLNKTGATGAIAKEGMFINKSLSALGDVINARANRLAHVPYRNSVLTSALQDCIAGESKTLMILQLNPSNESIDETYNSLNFASRMREVESQKPQNSPRKRNWMPWLVFNTVRNIHENHVRKSFQVEKT